MTDFLELVAQPLNGAIRDLGRIGKPLATDMERPTRHSARSVGDDLRGDVVVIEVGLIWRRMVLGRLQHRQFQGECALRTSAPFGVMLRALQRAPR